MHWDYLAELLLQAAWGEPALEFPSTWAKRLDRKSLLAAGATLDQLARVRHQIVEVLEV